MADERFTFDRVDWPEFLFHMQRYALAARLAQGKRVLDCPCGEGYGAAFVASAATHVTGVDIDATTILRCRERYATVGNSSFDIGDFASLPYDDASFDVVLCFEGIEHVDSAKQTALLGEIGRVLRADGLLLISTPDRAVGEQRGYANPFHVAEMTLGELQGRLRRQFGAVDLYGQEINMATALWHLGAQRRPGVAGDWVDQVALDDGRHLRAQEGNQSFYYGLAICSNRPANLPRAHYFSSYGREPAFALWNRVDRAEQRLAEESAASQARFDKAEARLLQCVEDSQSRLAVADAELRSVRIELERVQEQLQISERNAALLAREIVEHERSRFGAEEREKVAAARCAALERELADRSAELALREQQSLGRERALLERALAAETFVHSRMGRLARRYYALYRLPLIGAPLRLARAAAGRVQRAVRR